MACILFDPLLGPSHRHAEDGAANDCYAKTRTAVADAPRCAAGIAAVEIIWEGADPVTIIRLS
jgi:hypothetical protein